LHGIAFVVLVAALLVAGAIMIRNWED
jgi:hypothetical protein